MRSAGHRLLGRRFAQQIVDEVAATLEQNLNLMDDQGVIIASRDASRIGVVHPGAQRVIRSGEPVAIWPGEEPPGTRAGLNLPLRSGETVIGVVGVTGNPEDITSIAQVVQLATQVLIERAAEQDASERREAADRRLITALLLGEDGLASLRRQFDTPDRHLPAPWQLTVLLPRDSRDQLEVFGSSTLGLLAARRVRWAEFRGATWVLGTASERTRELVRSVAEAEHLRAVSAPETADLASLRAGGRSLAALNQRRAVLDGAAHAATLDELAVELAVAHLPLEQCRLLAQRVAGLTAVQRETVRVLATHGRAADAGRSMHAHRNTVAQRGERIHALTGLDPRDTRHLLTLSLAVCAARVVEAGSDA